MEPTLDQLLIEATEAMNALTIAVVQRSDFTQATLAMRSAQEALDRLNAVIALEAAAKVSRDEAEGFAGQSALSATSASASETAAATSATSAAASATSATASKNAAATSATQAASSATASATSATQAGTSATQAATSATNAGTSATSAANSATAAAASATSASNSATTASTAASTATTKATEAAASATSATASATTATTKAAEASTSATNAASSANTAATRATEAASSATMAASSQTAAETAADQAAASAQAATLGGIRYDTVQTLTVAQKTQAKNNIGLTESLGAAGGIATLDGAGKVPAAQLPSYVDDVLEYATFAALPAAGEVGKLYILSAPHTINGMTSAQFRWSGSAYTAIVASPGSTDAVAEGSVNRYFTEERARAAVVDIAGNAATASSVPYSGLTGAVPTWNQNTTGNAATATKLLAPRTINGVSFDGSADITVFDGTKLSLSGGVMTGAITFAAGQAWPTFNQSTTGNAATATALQTARTIGGVSFNGTANISLPGVNIAGTQNTTGTAANITGIAAIANGGTGASTAVQGVRNLNRGAYARETPGGRLVPGTRYCIWTGDGPVTMGLPFWGESQPGDEIEIVNFKQTWGTNAFTVTCYSNTRIQMLTENLVCNHNAGGFTLVCVHKDTGTAFWTVRT